MNNEQKVYRSFPHEVIHPSRAILLTQDEFNQVAKEYMKTISSAIDRHTETVIWHSKNNHCYILQIRLDNKPDIYAKSTCTWNDPFGGMDILDGHIAQDIDNFIVCKELGCYSERLNIFDGRDCIPIKEYLDYHDIFK